MRDKPCLRVKRRLTGIRMETYIAPAGLEFAGVDGIIQHAFEQFIAQGRAQDGIIDGEERFYASIQVALHHVRAAQQNFFVAAIAKVIDATVLQKAAYDAAHADSFAQTRDAGAQTADTTYNQVDLHPGLRGAVE